MTRLDPRPSPRDLATAAARRYVEHPTLRNRIDADVKARLAGVVSQFEIRGP